MKHMTLWHHYDHSKKRYKQFAEESQLQEIHWIKINNENKAWKFNLESQLLDLSYIVK